MSLYDHEESPLLLLQNISQEKKFDKRREIVLIYFLVETDFLNKRSGQS